METSKLGKEKKMAMRGGKRKEGKEENGRVRRGRKCRRRRDRPEFVQLGKSVSSGFRSQNGQTQTEERNMDVRGCTKGKGRWAAWEKEAEGQ